MEIPALHIGLVPLILGARQLFEEVLKISKSLQKWLSEVDEIRNKIAVQQTIFENGSMPLLYIAVRNRQDVDNMYEDMGHPIWTHRKTNRDLEDTMAHLKTPCLQTLQRIQKNLTAFRYRLLSLKGREKRKGKKGHQLWRTPFWSKWPSSDPADQFPHILEDLGNCNDIFCTFVRQTVQNKSKDMLSPPLLCAVEDSSNNQAIRVAQASDSHFLCYQRASQDLYETLSGVWSCHEASAHSLSMALDFKDSRVGGSTSSRRIRFRLSLKTAISSRPFELVVDSTQSTSCPCLGAKGSLLSNLPHSGNSASDMADSEHSRATTPSYKSPKCASAFGVQCQNFNTGMCPDLPENDVQDLGQEEKLCYLLENLSHAMDTYMSGIGTSFVKNCDSGGTMQSHSFYLLGRELHGQSSQSLDEVLLQAKTRRLTISLEDKLCMAVSLATAVLYLHSTSWIPQRWGSKDVMIPGNRNKDGIRLKDPFLRAQLENSSIEFSAPKRVSLSSENSSENSALFSLGVVLLELAFSAPLRELQVHEDFTSGLVKQEREYLTVMRLSETVSREVGSRYANVVRTCFSQILRPREIHSLRKPELDDIMANHVVKELEASLRGVLSVELSEKGK